MAISITNLDERKNASSAFLQPTRSTPLVLVVDDHEDTRFMLNTLLAMHGYDVVEAVDGVEAIRIAESARPDLILMDGSLPHLDGLTALRRMREHATLGGVPVVMLSGHAEQSYARAAFAAGCDDFLVKPIDFTQLMNALEKHTGKCCIGKREAVVV